MKRLALPLVLTGFITAATLVAPPSYADGPPGVADAIRVAGGRYVSGGASLTGADCSGLVSVAQSLAMGVPPRRFGNTISLISGHWPYAIPGAVPEDRLIIGANSSHMSASIDGVNVEATTSGAPFKIGPSARSPWTFDRQWHIDPAVLI